MTNTLEMANLSEKRIEIWDSGLPIQHIWIIFEPFVVKPFWWNCLTVACNLKTAAEQN